MQRVSLPSLTFEHREYLNGPILADELECTLSRLAKHKIPGMDSIPTKWYLAHKEYLLPHLLFASGLIINGCVELF